MTSLESQYKAELEEILDRYFPKGDAARGQALMLFAEAMTRIRKTITAFGGCTKCYGKGYATTEEIGTKVTLCSCDRGNQLLENIVKG